MKVTDRASALERIRTLALEAVTTEEPHWTHPELADLYLPPRDAHPVFFGAYDWHSAVHGYWTLAQWLNLEEGGGDTEVTDHLELALARPHLLKEVATMAAGVLDRWEIPYGLAWVVMLHHALETNVVLSVRRLAPAMEPLRELARRRLREWISSKTQPDRTGTHRNTAFSLALIRSGDADLWSEIGEHALSLWDTQPPAALVGEAQPHDFLSPALTEAALITSTMDDPTEAAKWISRHLPDGVAELRALEPVFCPDPSDGRTSHLLGLNLSRAHALYELAKHTSPQEIAVACIQAADRHLEVGLRALEEKHFATTHWIGTFALRAILAAPPPSAVCVD